MCEYVCRGEQSQTSKHVDKFDNRDFKSGCEMAEEENTEGQINTAICVTNAGKSLEG